MSIDTKVSEQNTPPSQTILTQGETKMAEIITGTVSGYVNNQVDTIQASVSDVRREAAEHTNEIVKEGMKGDYATQSKINETERANSQQIDAFEDVTNNNFMTVSRDTADLRAQVVALGYQVRDGHMGLSKDIELSSLKGVIEGQKNTQFLAEKISRDGDETRALINDLKYNDLNRELIERNAILAEERSYGRHWRGNFDQSQWAALNSQLQAFQSQLATSTQGMVNFGTQAGVGQTSSANQVR